MDIDNTDVDKKSQKAMPPFFRLASCHLVPAKLIILVHPAHVVVRFDNRNRRHLNLASIMLPPVQFFVPTGFNCVLRK